MTLVKNEFSKWKEALERFQSLEALNLHRAALSAAAAVKGGVNVASACERAKQKEMKDARKAVLGMLSSLLYLTYQGLVVRGHNDTKNDLRQLLELRVNGIPELNPWPCPTKYKWVSHGILNEMLQIMARDVLLSLIREVCEAGHYAMITYKTVNELSKSRCPLAFG